MLLPEIVLIHHKDLLNGELLQSTREPYEVARAIRFETETELNAFVIRHNLYGSFAPVTGYNIIICYLGKLPEINEKIVLGHLVPRYALPVLEKMADLYQQERIRGKETRVKKYLK